MSEEEKKAIEIVKSLACYYDDDCLLDDEEIEENEEVNSSINIVVGLIEKQQKEIEKNQKFKEYVVNLIMLWDKKELPENNAILEALKTIMSELSRLEDIEDRKIQVAVKFVEEKRDKYWKDKIGKIIYSNNEDLEIILKIKKLLEENNND